MTDINLFHRQAFDCMREKRLCRFAENLPASPNVPPQQPQLNPQQQSWWEWAKGKGLVGGTIDTIGTLGVETGKFVAVTVPGYFLDRIKDVWNRVTPSKEEAQAFLTNTASFFRDVPVLGEMMRSTVLDADYQTLKNLTDHEKWIAAFRDPDILTKSAVIPQPSGMFGPREFLASIAPEERQKLYMSYIDRFLPPGIQEDIVRKSREPAQLETQVWNNLATALPDALKPPEDRLPRGTFLPAGTILPEGTLFNRRGPEGKLVPPIIEDPKDIAPEFIPPRGLFLPAGATIPAGAIIPEEVEPQEWRKKSPQDRWRDVHGMLPRLNRVMGGIMGTEAPDNLDIDEQSWARQTLAEYYRPDDQRPQKGLWNDLEVAFSQQRNRGFGPAATSPELLAQRLAPSRLRGALALGVLQQPDLERLQSLLQQREFERNIAIGRVAKRVEDTTQASKREFAREAMDLRDVWYGMSGPEKLVLFVMGAFLLTKKGFRNVAAALGVGYFATKFLFKVDDPVGSLSKWLNKPIGALTKGSRNVMGEWAPGYRPDIQERSRVMLGFLSDFDREHMETQAQGFALLSDVQMGRLAENFRQDEKGTWILDISRGNTVDKSMELAAKEYGWTKGYKKFFMESPQNLPQVSDAVAFMFYKKAAENPAHAAAVEKVEEAMRMLPVGCTYTNLATYHFAGDAVESVENNKKVQEAAREYNRLVAAGRAACVGSDMKLGAYVENLLGLQRRRLEAKNGASRQPQAAPNAAPPQSVHLATAEGTNRALADLQRARPTVAAERTRDLEEQQRMLTTAEATRRTSEEALRTARAEEARRRQEAVTTTNRTPPDEAVSEKTIEVSTRQREIAEARNGRDIVAADTARTAMDIASQKALTEAAKMNVEELQRQRDLPVASSQATEAARINRLLVAAQQQQAEAELQQKQLETIKADKDRILLVRQADIEVAEQRQALAQAELKEAQAVAKRDVLSSEATKKLSELSAARTAQEEAQKKVDALTSSTPATEAQESRDALAAAKAKVAVAQNALTAAEAAKTTAENAATAERPIVEAASKAVKISEAQQRVVVADQDQRKAQAVKGEKDIALTKAKEKVEELQKVFNGIPAEQSRQTERAQAALELDTARAAKITAEVNATTAAEELSRKNQAVQQARTALETAKQ